MPVYIHSTVSDEPFMLEEDAYLSGVLSGDRQFVRVKSDQPTWVHVSTIMKITADEDPFTPSATAT